MLPPLTGLFFTIVAGVRSNVRLEARLKSGFRDSNLSQDVDRMLIDMGGGKTLIYTQTNANVDDIYKELRGRWLGCVALFRQGMWRGAL